MVFVGTGSLTVTATGKSGIVSDDYVHFMGGKVTVNCSSSVVVSGSDTLKPACIRGKDYFKITEGTLDLTSTGTGGTGISSDGNGYFNGGSVRVTVKGSNFGSSGGGGFPGFSNGGSNGVSAKGLKFDGNLVFKGSRVVVNSTAHEGIEAKGTLAVTGGLVYSHSQSDDAINSGGNLDLVAGDVLVVQDAELGVAALLGEGEAAVLVLVEIDAPLH